jgi:hypothetical protein
VTEALIAAQKTGEELLSLDPVGVVTTNLIWKYYEKDQEQFFPKVAIAIGKYVEKVQESLESLARQLCTPFQCARLALKSQLVVNCKG